MVGKPGEVLGAHTRHFLLLTALLQVGTSAVAAPPSPTLIAIDGIGSETPDVSLPLRPLLAPLTSLRLQFDLPVIPVPSMFRVLAAGPDRRVDTTACLTPAEGDDVEVDIVDTLALEAGTEIVLRLDTPTGLTADRYRLVVCDTVTNAIGQRAGFDDRNDKGVGVAIRDFEIAEIPHLDNPNFSTDLAGWRVESYPFPPDSGWSAIDADAAGASGSLRLAAPAGNFGMSVRSDSCRQVPVWRFPGKLDARVRFRYRVMSGSVQVLAATRVGFGPDQGEPICVGPTISESTHVLRATASSEFATFDSGTMEMTAGPLAELSLFVDSTDGGSFEILLDDIGLSFDPSVIFSASFERQDIW